MGGMGEWWEGTGALQNPLESTPFPDKLRRAHRELARYVYVEVAFGASGNRPLLGLPLLS
jgi:hypothetical protein